MLLVATALWIPLALFVPVFGVMMLVRTLRRGPRRPVGFAAEAAFVAVGALWLTGFMLPSLVPFLIVAPVAAIAVPVLFSQPAATAGT